VASEQDKSQFIQEAEAASTMNHANIYTIHVMSRPGRAAGMLRISACLRRSDLTGRPPSFGGNGEETIR